MDPEIILVGHSMGGLFAVDALDALGTPTASAKENENVRVSRLACIASPFHG